MWLPCNLDDTGDTVIFVRGAMFFGDIDAGFLSGTPCETASRIDSMIAMVQDLGKLVKTGMTDSRCCFYLLLLSLLSIVGTEMSL